jgi:lysozyme family protein
MTDFDKAFEQVIGIEGGYVNDPKDPGGETKYGVADLRDGVKDGMVDLNADRIPDLIVKDLTLEQAKVIYKRDYWNKVKGDELPYPLNMFVFDAAVNQGIDPAIKLLQKTLGIAQDGILGVATMKAAKAAGGDAVSLYLADRALRYTGTRNFDQYGRGWLRRLFVLAMAK